MPAQTMANSVIVSAMRLIDVRHSARTRKKNAETNVPPEAMAIHQT